MQKAKVTKKKAKKTAETVIRSAAAMAVCFSPVWVTAIVLGILY